MNVFNAELYTVFDTAAVIAYLCSLPVERLARSEGCPFGLEKMVILARGAYGDGHSNEDPNWLQSSVKISQKDSYVPDVIALVEDAWRSSLEASKQSSPQYITVWFKCPTCQTQII